MTDDDGESDALTTELLALWKAQILGQVGMLRLLCASGVLAPDQAVTWFDEASANLDTASTLVQDFARPVLAEARAAFARLSQ
jgi:hypothetical protein